MDEIEQCLKLFRWENPVLLEEAFTLLHKNAYEFPTAVVHEDYMDRHTLHTAHENSCHVI